MKSIRQLLAEQLSSVPIGANGRPDEIQLARLKWAMHSHFWSGVRGVLDPCGGRLQWNASGRSFYEDVPGNLRGFEIEESIEQMKLLFSVNRLSFGTWFKVRPVVRELLFKGGNEFGGADIAVCSTAEFVRLEAHSTQRPVREVRRPEVPRRRAREGHPGAAAVRRKPARPGRRLSGASPTARSRPRLSATRPRSHGGSRRPPRRAPGPAGPTPRGS